jgi:glycosyltransferase involved in cell wall biosynthesis
MRVVIDATPLLVRSGGVKTYLYHWIDALRRLPAPFSLALYPRLGRFGPLRHDGSVLSRPGTWARFALVGMARLGGAAAASWIAGPAEVFHASNLTRSVPRRARLTATLHDLTTLLVPEVHAAANVRADRDFFERIASRAARLIAVSRHTLEDAVRLLRFDPERMEVIYPGVAESFFDTPGRRTAEVRRRLGLGRPYALFIGTIEPRKNLDRLLDAWAGLKRSVREEFDLVVAGPPGWSSESTLARLRDSAGVRYLGYVPESELPPLTAGATLFVYPSLYEGFGLPVAQAMACGVPVVASGVSSLPEVVGEAGLLVDPHSVAEIRAGVERLLLSPSLRAELAVKARQRAACFRWERAAAASVSFFERAAD